MARKRSTIAVNALRDRLNTYLRNTDQHALHGTQTLTAAQWQSMRLGACQLVETFLHETGNYRGYTYVTPHTIDESSRSYS